MQKKKFGWILIAIAVAVYFYFTYVPNPMREPLSVSWMQGEKLYDEPGVFTFTIDDMKADSAEYQYVASIHYSVVNDGDEFVMYSVEDVQINGWRVANYHSTQRIEPKTKEKKFFPLEIYKAGAEKIKDIKSVKITIKLKHGKNEEYKTYTKEFSEK